MFDLNAMSNRSPTIGDQADGGVDAPVDEHARDRDFRRAELAGLVDDVEAGGGRHDVAEHGHEADDGVGAELDSEYGEPAVQTLLELFQLRYAIALVRHSAPPVTLLRRYYA